MGIFFFGVVGSNISPFLEDRLDALLDLLGRPFLGSPSSFFTDFLLPERGLLADKSPIFFFPGRGLLVLRSV